MRVCLALYYIHFEFPGYPCNVFGSQRCDLLTNRTIFCSKSHLFLSHWEWDSKQNNQPDFKALFTLTNHIAGKWKKKGIVLQIWLLNCSISILVRNHTCDFKSTRAVRSSSFDFEIRHMNLSFRHLKIPRFSRTGTASAILNLLNDDVIASFP